MAKDLIHKTLAWAMVELRTRMQWNQGQLAQYIHRYSSGRERLPLPSQQLVSRWENGDSAPSLHYRLALAKMARGQGHDDLAVIFEAAPVAWKLAAVVVNSGVANGR
jgi:transcriptional regulator with XRE-family HTH domain